MAKRIKIEPAPETEEQEEGAGGAYFEDPRKARTFTTGCTLLDCVLGGGWAEDRIFNIIGNASAGKSLLAIEAAANFVETHPTGRVRYVETEAAFDREYAVLLGLPLERVTFPEDDEARDHQPIYTVEELFADMKAHLAAAEDAPLLYIVDSLDALSDRAELDRDMEEGTYGTGKARKMSQLFRRLVRDLEGKHVTVLIVSQVRDKIGVVFGKKTTRSGGRALDFYASQVVELAQVGQIKRTRNKVSRPVGVKVKAKCTKNKVGMPFRECLFPIIFTYGVEDVRAGLEWLLEVKRTKDVGLTETEAKRLVNGLEKLTDEEYEQTRADVTDAVKAAWAEIEDGFRPTRRKYR